MTPEQERAELLPCPFCGAGTTEVRENGRPWLGTRWGEPVSVSIRHWCEQVDGQPSRMIERVGRDRAAAIAAWNRRAALQSQDREDAARLDWLDSMNAKLNSHYGTTYRWELVLSPHVVRLMAGYGGSGHVAAIDLNDSAANGVPSCREAIDRARRIEGNGE